MQNSVILIILSAALLIAASSAAPAQAAGVARDAADVQSPYRLHTVQYRECSQRVGPFVTQSTAWQRLNDAKRYGYATSGVFPCYDGGSRGYCFNVFYAC